MKPVPLIEPPSADTSPTARCPVRLYCPASSAELKDAPGPNWPERKRPPSPETTPDDPLDDDAPLDDAPLDDAPLSESLDEEAPLAEPVAIDPEVEPLALLAECPDEPALPLAVEAEPEVAPLLELCEPVDDVVEAPLTPCPACVPQPRPRRSASRPTGPRGRDRGAWVMSCYLPVATIRDFNHRAARLRRTSQEPGFARRSARIVSVTHCMSLVGATWTRRARYLPNLSDTQPVRSGARPRS